MSLPLHNITKSDLCVHGGVIISIYYFNDLFFKPKKLRTFMSAMPSFAAETLELTLVPVTS